MSLFKEQLAADAQAVFFNPTEFGEVHNINDTPTIIVVDSDALKERADKEYGGITTGMILYYVPVSAFSQRPKVGDTQKFDKKLMWIESANESDGVYEILLNQNRGE